jgi:Holliday junction resolvasome RuvABC endonuclease subunit
MTTATMSPAQIAQRIAAIADTLDELSNQYTDLAVAVEELREENEGAKRYEAADVWSGHAMHGLYEAERCLRQVAHFLKA